MKHVALVTCSTFPELSESDKRLIEPLRKEGFIPYVVPWDRKNIDWNLFDGIVLRSCWNYTAKYSQFMDWLSDLKHINAKVWNPVSIIRWNSHKSYLLDLAKKGIPIIPTVIKPAIGNSGKGIDYLIQPFMTEVVNEGEYRFIFIGKKLSHTVIKKPKQTLLVNPSKTLITQAANVIHTIGADPLYARVDGINHNGTFMLMEVELIEPNLYFDLHPPSAGTFARALKKRYE